MGLLLPLAAGKLIFSSPKLLLLSIMPVLISITALTGLIFGLVTSMSSYLMAKLGVYFAVTLKVIIVIGLIFVAFQVMVFLIDVLAIPFSDYLALHTEKSIGQNPPERAGFGHTFRLLSLDFGKTALNTALLALFTVGTWIPMVNLFFFLGIALLNTLNFISYPQSRRMLGVHDSFAWLKKNKSRSLGFGIATTVLFSIPVINFFALPLSVVGGTLLYFKPKQELTAL